MRGWAQLQRRVEALEREQLDAEGLAAELAVMTDDELRECVAELQATPWELLRNGTERQMKRIAELSDLELMEYLRLCELARQQGKPLPSLSQIGAER